MYVNPKTLQPYSQLQLTLQATTLWGSSRRTSVRLRSPMSVPSIPIRPRVYVTFGQLLGNNMASNNVMAEFRWSHPTHANGIILGYKVDCWSLSSVHHKLVVMDDHIVSGSTLGIVIPGLSANKTYKFQVGFDFHLYVRFY